MKPVIKTEYFEVHPFDLNDAYAVASWMSVSPMDLFMVSSSLLYPVAAQILIERMQKADPKEHRFYSVFLIEHNEHIGYFEIKNINEKTKVGTGAHIILSPKYRGKGIGKEFIGLLSEVGFSVLGLHRIGISVHIVNRTAIAAYIRAGYLFEGIIREALIFNGKRYSLYQMSLLRSNWEEIV